MDPYHLFLAILAVYISALVVIGLISSRRRLSITDFWLAGRELGPVNIGLSAAASWMTASALLLSTGLFLLMGIGSIWVWVFPNVAALAIIAAISGKIKNLPSLTQPELMEMRYDPLIRAPVALAIAVMMVLFSVVDFIGFKLVLGTFFGVEPQLAILIMAASVAFYVSLGGFRAVVRTDILQYLLLLFLAAFVAAMTWRLSSDQGVAIAAAASDLGSEWWNPFAMGGIMGALVFQLALLPGWVAEQDPWQKVWAARDERTARLGLLAGAALLALVYFCCLISALGLSVLYPRPGNEIEAEMLYLRVISDHVPSALLAVLSVGFAAASMSCTDTFATSGASCISRDIVQRHLKPEATVKEMLIINRALVIVMIAISAFVALNVESIMEAVIIATVIGTTSYFFPIIGGLYWKRATQWGALAGLVAGGGTQVVLISYELFWLRQPLDTLSPLLTEHGVLVGLSLSALFFVGVSLATPPTEKIRLAPFFPEVAEEIFGKEMLAIRKGSRYPEIQEMVEENVAGERAHLNLYLNLRPTGTDIGDMRWVDFVERLKSENSQWFTPSGRDIVYRLSQADMLACVKMVRGDAHQIWLSAEPRKELSARQRDELYLAFEEIEGALLNFGLVPSLSKT